MNIVTQSQLRRITGSGDPHRQADVLRRHGVSPIVRDDGKLIVFEAALIQAQLAGDSGEEPDWSALDGAA